jgi:hypothetical protein
VAPDALEREVRMRQRTPDPPPASPLLSGVYSFPFYETTRKAWLSLSLTFAALGLAIRVLILLWPF